ncbi:Protein CBR-NHR-275 [Caenorhabditis briggsae]|uniref:Protein CBR-NHR-275 n=1 Tax=Caenorhabditis briggsae TaxID=6238 RepID=A8WPW8_CAEBR|nr:Protein CBR-NHR-275 [Caenorhabditis briggsae]CAP22526.1 Protein CBR-NHR-275 [Caenorhabditis briggsae]
MAESSPEYCPASTSTSGGESSPESSESHRKIENCQVCGQKAHGLHFGAITCRACAAFFRRVAAGANFVIKCRKGGGKCEIVSNGRSCCKKCRLKKCKEMGMNIENFQYDRDPLSTSKQITPSMAMYLGRPEFIILCDPETARNSITTKIDLTEIIDKATKILMSDIKIPRSSGQNRLRKLSTASNIERFSVSADDDFHEVTAIGLKETMSFWEHDILTVAKWLTHFDEFQDLKPDLKLTFLKTIWSVWNRLEKLGRTTMFLKSKTAPSWDETPIFQANDVRINLKDLKLDIEWLSNYSVEQIAYYIEGVGDWSSFHSIQPMLELDPTEVEINYMLAQISFSFATRDLQGELSEIAEKFLQLIADDLHNYYTRELSVSRYSDRVLKMMKINNLVMKNMFERKEKLAIARTFDIFHVEFSDPEMFKDMF